MKIEIATAAELRAASRVAHGQEAQHHVRQAHDPQRSPMVSERLLSDSVRLERSGSTTLAPNSSAASSIGPIGFQPVRR